MQEGLTVWLTGWYKAGKTTLAIALEQYLRRAGLPHVQRLDGDVVREDLSPELGFSKKDRDEHIRRVAFVAELLSNNGVATLVAVISPYREARNKARQRCLNFVEVYVKCPLDVLIRRDAKGLYARAAAGEVGQFTGISDPYEEQEDSDVVVETSIEPVSVSLHKIILALEERGLIPKGETAWQKLETGLHENSITGPKSTTAPKSRG